MTLKKFQPGMPCCADVCCHCGLVIQALGANDGTVDYDVEVELFGITAGTGCSEDCDELMASPLVLPPDSHLFSGSFCYSNWSDDGPRACVGGSGIPTGIPTVITVGTGSICGSWDSAVAETIPTMWVDVDFGGGFPYSGQIAFDVPYVSETHGEQVTRFLSGETIRLDSNDAPYTCDGSSAYALVTLLL